MTAWCAGRARGYAPAGAVGSTAAIASISTPNRLESLREVRSDAFSVGRNAARERGRVLPRLRSEVAPAPEAVAPAPAPADTAIADDEGRHVVARVGDEPIRLDDLLDWVRNNPTAYNTFGAQWGRNAVLHRLIKQRLLGAAATEAFADDPAARDFRRTR